MPAATEDREKHREEEVFLVVLSLGSWLATKGVIRVRSSLRVANEKNHADI